MGYYDTLPPEELEKYKKDYIEDAKTGKQYEVVFRNNRYEIDFFVTWIFIPDILLRHNVGKFYMNKENKICFKFSKTCPREIVDSITEYYGNGTKGMIFTNMLTGETSDILEAD